MRGYVRGLVIGLSALVCWQYATAQEVSPRRLWTQTQPEAYELFPDEALAVAQYQAEPGPERIFELADIRTRHALRLVREAIEQDDPDLYVRAADYAESAVALVPDNPMAWYRLGELFAALAHEDPRIAAYAEVYLGEALQLDPELAGARLSLARVLDHLGEAERAMDEWERALSELETLAILENLEPLCAIYRREECLDRGIAFLRGLLCLEPRLNETKLALADLLAETGEREEALAWVEQVRQNPEIRAFVRQQAEERFAALSRGEDRP